MLDGDDFTSSNSMETSTSNTEISISIIVVIFIIAVLAIASVLLTLIGMCCCIGYRRKSITLISKNDIQEYSNTNEDETQAYKVTTTSNVAYQGHEEVKDSLIDSEHIDVKTKQNVAYEDCPLWSKSKTGTGELEADITTTSNDAYNSTIPEVADKTIKVEQNIAYHKSQSNSGGEGRYDYIICHGKK